MFHDALADRLAGERGRAIVAAAPRTIRNGWWLVARTKVIDDVIIEAIGDGCDKVLNLAAGLDTRPYRLDLPPDFTWVEADLPQLLAEKEQALADQRPRCRLTRHAVDLADPAARDAFLNEELAGATKALVLTEGLLMYLEDSDVVALSTAFKRPEVAWWMLDFAAPGLQKRMNKKTRGLMQSAPFKFAPANGLAYFEDLGWRASRWNRCSLRRTDSIDCRGGCVFWRGYPSRIRAIRATRPGAASSASAKPDYFGAVSSSAMLSGSRNSRM